MVLWFLSDLLQFFQVSQDLVAKKEKKKKGSFSHSFDDNIVCPCSGPGTVLSAMSTGLSETKTAPALRELAL